MASLGARCANGAGKSGVLAWYAQAAGGRGRCSSLGWAIGLKGLASSHRTLRTHGAVWIVCSGEALAAAQLGGGAGGERLSMVELQGMFVTLPGRMAEGFDPLGWPASAP
jgi:hypothetical protein